MADISRHCLQLGLSVIDRFTFSTLDYLQQMKVGDSIRNGTLRDLFSFYNPRVLFSTPDYRADILGRSIDEVPITDFLGSVLDIRLQFDEEAYPIEGVELESSTKADVTQSARQPQAASTGQRMQRTPTARRVQQFRFTNEFFVAAALFALTAIAVTATKL